LKILISLRINIIANLPRPSGKRLKMVVIVLLDLFIKLNRYTKSKTLIPNNSRINIMHTVKKV